MKRYFKLLSVFTVIAMCFQFSANALDTSITELSNEIATLESLPEDTSLRTEISKHFKISENGYIAAVYDQPIHYLDDNGVWQDIDNSLVAVNVPSNKLNKTTNGSIDKNINAGEIKYLENKTNPFKVRLPDKLNNNNPIMVSYEGFTLGFKMPEINSRSSANIAKVDLLAKKQVKEKIANTNDPEARLELLRDDAVNIINHISDVSYDDITSNTEATYQISGKQLNQSLIFNSKPTKESYSYELFYDGLVPIIQDTEAVYFYNQSELDNEPVFILDAPYVYDAMDNICSNNTVTINTTETGCQYTFTPNNNWMNSPDATYPITIQSKITTPTDSASIQDNGVNEYNPNDNYYTTDRMYVGSNYANNKGYESRIYIRFPRIASIPTSAYIYKADMILDHHSTASWQSAQANRVDVYEVGNYNWDSKKITWNSQKDYKFTNYITNQTTDKKKHMNAMILLRL